MLDLSKYVLSLCTADCYNLSKCTQLSHHVHDSYTGELALQVLVGPSLAASGNGLFLCIHDEVDGDAEEIGAVEEVIIPQGMFKVGVFITLSLKRGMPCRFQFKRLIDCSAPMHLIAITFTYTHLFHIRNSDMWLCKRIFF